MGRKKGWGSGGTSSKRKAGKRSTTKQPGMTGGQPVGFNLDMKLRVASGVCPSYILTYLSTDVQDGSGRMKELVAKPVHA
ncbi:hypothetical protein RvY_12546 [Ramazzottius varieornatus]|uniref:Uncharacterized protein n=1 Tax=Ramazzottius varieornatus TaxID=947166 RepID=A0A1D1VLU5_RAMVA|nr:hypothetical protein RvY_12546 [Ramazzottius varieornatus]